MAFTTPLRPLTPSSPSPATQPPSLLYGTAWHANNTQARVSSALAAGFYAFDTAEQRKNYYQALVGEALQDALRNQSVRRGELWLSGEDKEKSREPDVSEVSLLNKIQTKFSPYDNGHNEGYQAYECLGDIVTQVKSSVAISLSELWCLSPPCSSTSLDCPYVDCLILHSLLDTLTETLAAWSALEQFVPRSARSLGVSNISLPRLRVLYDSVTIKPSVFQNPFSAENNLDRAVRGFCTEKGIAYQALFVVKKNRALMESASVRELAGVVGIGREPALIRLVAQNGVGVVVGSENEEHMRADVQGMKAVRSWREEERNRERWTKIVEEYRLTVGD